MDWWFALLRWNYKGNVYRFIAKPRKKFLYDTNKVILDNIVNAYTRKKMSLKH